MIASKLKSQSGSKTSRCEKQRRTKTKDLGSFKMPQSKDILENLVATNDKSALNGSKCAAMQKSKKQMKTQDLLSMMQCQAKLIESRLCV